MTEEYSWIVTAPGQGAQRPGMLDQWVSNDADALATVRAWSEASDLDLLSVSQDIGALSDTSVAQPTIVAASLLSYATLSRVFGYDANRAVFAGHSVGELAAIALAGYISSADAVWLARQRGLAMAKACETVPSGMVAVMPSRRNPATDDEIVGHIRQRGLNVANWNGGHQFVAAGRNVLLDELVGEPPAGVRCVRLKVAGAFHTQAMTPALREFEECLQTVDFRESKVRVLSNRDGAVMEDSAEIKRRVASQVVASVRWDLCMATLSRIAPSASFVELAPASSLARLWRSERPLSQASQLTDGALRDVERPGAHS